MQVLESDEEKRAAGLQMHINLGVMADAAARTTVQLIFELQAFRQRRAALDKTKATAAAAPPAAKVKS